MLSASPCAPIPWGGELVGQLIGSIVGRIKRLPLDATFAYADSVVELIFRAIANEVARNVAPSPIGPSRCAG